MVPQALGAFLAFLGVVAPGIYFELRREKRRIGATGWSFRDISTVALVGLTLTCVSAVLTFAIGRWLFGAANLLDPKAWAQQGGRYFSDKFYPVVLTMAAVFAVSLLLAFGWAWVLGRSSRRGEGFLVKNSLWHEAFLTDAPKGTTPWVHVELTDGSAYFGYRWASTEGESVDNREITLTGAALKYRPPPDPTGAAQPAKVIGDQWRFVIVRSTEIRYLRVVYVDDEAGWAGRTAHPDGAQALPAPL